MATWQLQKRGKPTTLPLFDDEQPEVPGDDNFTTTAVEAYVESLGSQADGFNYVGETPRDG